MAAGQLSVTQEEIDEQVQLVRESMFTRCTPDVPNVPNIYYWGPSKCPQAPGNPWNAFSTVIQQPQANDPRHCGVVTAYKGADVRAYANELTPADRENGIQYRGQVLLTFTTSRVAFLMDGTLKPWSDAVDFSGKLLIVDLMKKNGKWTNWVGLFPTAADFGNLGSRDPGRVRKFPMPPDVSGPSMLEVKRFRELFLSCSNGNLVAVAPSTTTVPASDPTTSPTRALTGTVPPSRNTAVTTPQVSDHGILLTHISRTAFRTATIEAPGRLNQEYNLFTIDLRDFREGGLLQINIRIAPDSGTGGSFDLFGEPRPRMQNGRFVGSLAGSYDIAKGSATTIRYRFTGGQVLTFNAEGNWFSPKGATGTIHFRTTVIE